MNDDDDCPLYRDPRLDCTFMNPCGERGCVDCDPADDEDTDDSNLTGED